MARILPYCHEWLAELVVWGEPACCAHCSQHCLNLQTGGLRGSMAGCAWLAGREYGLNSPCHVAHVGFRTSAQVQARVSFALVPLASFLPKPEFYHLARKQLTPNSSQSTTQHTWTTCQYKHIPCD